MIENQYVFFMLKIYTLKNYVKEMKKIKKAEIMALKVIELVAT